MTQVERDAICQSILAMSDEEKKVVLECIPVYMMLDYIHADYYRKEGFIENIKQAIHTAMV